MRVNIEEFKPSKHWSVMIKLTLMKTKQLTTTNDTINVGQPLKINDGGIKIDNKTFQTNANE